MKLATKMISASSISNQTSHLNKGISRRYHNIGAGMLVMRERQDQRNESRERDDRVDLRIGALADDGNQP